MEKAEGIGGFFFRASDPEKLANWYNDHLGISLTPKSYSDKPWVQKAGPTVFEPFNEQNEYLSRMTSNWALNLRVRNLDAMVSQLRSAGVDVEEDPESYPNGRFALLYDPDGNAIQLWEPAIMEAEQSD